MSHSSTFGGLGGVPEQSEFIGNDFGYVLFLPVFFVAAGADFGVLAEVANDDDAIDHS